jgi:hypothetical protein
VYINIAIEGAAVDFRTNQSGQAALFDEARKSELGPFDPGSFDPIEVNAARTSDATNPGECARKSGKIVLRFALRFFFKTR